MKKLKRSAEQIKSLVEGMGNCLATDLITVKGEKIGFMYRDYPDDEDDSGWRFLTGTESQGYLDNPKNSGVYDVNTIANYDPAIIPYLDSPIETELARIEDTDEFEILEPEDEE